MLSILLRIFILSGVINALATSTAIIVTDTHIDLSFWIRMIMFTLLALLSISRFAFALIESVLKFACFATMLSRISVLEKLVPDEDEACCITSFLTLQPINNSKKRRAADLINVLIFIDLTV